MPGIFPLMTVAHSSADIRHISLQNVNSLLLTQAMTVHLDTFTPPPFCITFIPPPPTSDKKVWLLTTITTQLCLYAHCI